jgi:starch-binding outer membrane protein SusE/F
MRVLSNFIWVAIMLPFIMWSCGPIDEPAIIPQTASTLTSPSAGTAIVLLQDEKEDTIFFQASEPDFGVSGNYTYNLEMAQGGTNFATAIALGSSTTPTIKVAVGDLNAKIVAAGILPDVASNIDFRIKTSIDRSLMPLVGAATTLSITPYTDVVVLPSLRVPGDYQGWSPPNENTVIYSVNSDNIYEGFVHILSGSGEFKFITGPEWDTYPDYGTGATPNSLAVKGGNLKIPGAFGTHRVKANITALTYELERIGIWGIIGNATAGGWDNETPMTFDAANNVLTITTNLTVGEMKFRTQTWDNNYGLGSADGIAGAGGDNIPVAEAGNYTITLDFKTPGEVRYSIVKN